MTDIILWRHADAEAGAPDLYRALTHKGEQQARRVARWLQDRVPADAPIWASPARRAQQTALALAHLGTRPLVTVDAFAPAARLDGALAALRSTGRAPTVVVVGHQPTLGELAGRLLGSDIDWPIAKGAVVWLATADDGRCIVRAALTPDLV